MANPNEFAFGAGELKATARYFDQIQRASDRLGRTRYQNIIKLNNELKFTSRYFDQIYRTALKLSRLKLMPRVTLDDKASGEIDRLLAKLGKIRSKRIQVAADVKMPVQAAAPKVKQKVEAAPQSAKASTPKLVNQPTVMQQQSMMVTLVDPSGGGPPIDFQPLVSALSINTDAVVRLTDKLGTLSFNAVGGGEEKKDEG